MKIDVELIIDIGQTYVKFYFFSPKHFIYINKIIFKNNYIKKNNKFFSFDHINLKKNIFKIIYENSFQFNYLNIGCVSFGSTAFYINA